MRVYSTQRNELYHVVVKKFYKHLSLSDTIDALIAKTLKLAREYNNRINKIQKNTSNLIDKPEFKTVGTLLTYYTINLTIVEYRATKDLADRIESGEAEAFEFDKALRYQFNC